MRQIAASEDNSTIFIAWQKPTGDIFVRGFFAATAAWISRFQVVLTNQPIDNTPLVMVIWQVDDYIVSILSVASQPQDCPSPHSTTDLSLRDRKSEYRTLHAARTGSAGSDSTAMRMVPSVALQRTS